MATIWITYAWDDNRDRDVDFVAQELQSVGAVVKLDRWNIGAGKRLWEQVAGFITSPAESDAWLLVATNTSLQSEPCKEEFAYALQRALRERTASFPVIALFLGPVDEALIPAGIQARLHVSITDPDWKERIVAAAEGRSPQISPAEIVPYVLKVHQPTGGLGYAIEVRPRAGVWAPFFAAVPLGERESLTPRIMVGPRDVPTGAGMLVNAGEGQSSDGNWWVMFAGNQANPTTSYYIWCSRLPTALGFGVNSGRPQYVAKLA